MTRACISSGLLSLFDRGKSVNGECRKLVKKDSLNNPVPYTISFINLL